MIRKKYPYLYETHLHTTQASACAQNTAIEMIDAAKAYGYAGIIMTNHNWGGNTCVSNSLSWEDWVDEFCGDYETAKAYGKMHDIDVFWGYEAGFCGTEFLIYGVTPEWMKAHPELRDASIEEQYDLVHEAGGIVVHAHPFREEWYIPEIRLYPEHVDAVEGINATHSCHKSNSHNDPEFDKRAIEYANLHQLPMTAGSDIHSTNMFGGGIAFTHRLHSIQDYCKAIQNKDEDYILTNGDHIYDKFGKLLK